MIATTNVFMPHAVDRPVAHAAPVHPPRPARHHAGSSGQQAALALQRAAGNRAVGRLLAASPPLSSVVVQRVESPEEQESIRQVLADRVHPTLIRKYDKTSDIPKPSAVKKLIGKVVVAAADRPAAYRAYAEAIAGTYFSAHTSDFQAGLVEEIVALATASESGLAEENKKRQAELEKLREQQSSAPPAKRPRPDATPGETRTYSTVEREELARRLGSPAVQDKLFDASRRGYGKHAAKAREGVSGAAALNTLPMFQPLSTHDMAAAQAGYTHQGFGDSLLLEKGVEEDYQVTMGRRGGQEIHQLGPYLPNGVKTSIKETISQILATKALTSEELAKAVDIRDPDELAAFLEEKSAPEWVLGKIRALRHLRAVEMDRGPETAGATALEHRSAAHLLSHMSAYPELTPLGPPQATVDLKKARKDALAKREAETDAESHDYSYIPTYIRERAVGSTTRMLTGFAADPKPDVEMDALIGAVLREDETPGEASEALVDALADVMRTPQHSGFDDDDEERKEN